MGPTAAMLPGDRLHLQHGPIDLIIGADGPVNAVRAAYVAARDRFQTILPQLVAELPALRRPVEPGQSFEGPVARRMAEAISRHTRLNEAPEGNMHSSGLTRGSVNKADVERRNTDPRVKPEGSILELDRNGPLQAGDGLFVTPMAAVAGSVADEMLAVMHEAAPDLKKIWVNNGGDIAVHLSGEATFEAAMVADPVTGREAGRLTLRAGDGIGGIATSGRHGRSLSLGIADAVTVLAKDAASADVAATLIANEVDLPGHPAIRRAPANEIDPDSDLGDRLVVVEVGALSDGEVRGALARGLRTAEAMIAASLIHSANLSLAGETRTLQSVIPALSGDPGQPSVGSSNSSLGHHAWAPGQAGGDGQEFSHALT